MSSQTKHNKGVLPARSRVLELAYQQPNRGSQGDFTEAVNQVAQTIFSGFGLSAHQVQQITASPQGTDAMTYHTPNHLGDEWSAALLVISCPERYGNAQTIEQVNTQVIRQTERLFRDFGLSSEAIKAGLSEASREMASTGSR